MLKELIKLANHLDQKGHRDLADRLDGVIKMAEPYRNEDIDDAGSNVSKPTPMLISLRNRLSDIGLDPTKAEELVSLWPKYNKNIRGRGSSLSRPELGAYGYFQELHSYVSSGPISTWADKNTKVDSVYLAISKAHAESDSVGRETPVNEAPSPVNEALDWSEASDSSERINKLADLMSGEFSTYVPGTFSR